MKTTIDIADALLERAKRHATAQGVTLKTLIEEALAAHLVAQAMPRSKFKLRFRGVKGEGLQAGIREGDWETIRGLIYGGSGG